jgi:hypothetical protein
MAAFSACVRSCGRRRVEVFQGERACACCLAGPGLGQELRSGHKRQMESQGRALSCLLRPQMGRFLSCGMLGASTAAAARSRLQRQRPLGHSSGIASFLGRRPSTLNAQVERQQWRRTQPSDAAEPQLRLRGAWRIRMLLARTAGWPDLHPFASCLRSPLKTWLQRPLALRSCDRSVRFGHGVGARITFVAVGGSRVVRSSE